MVTVYRVAAVWGNFQGAPGYTKFTFDNLTDAAARTAAATAVKNFFEGIKPHLPFNVSVTVQQTVQEYDMATGVLTGESQIVGVPAATTGTGTGAYAAGSGFFIGWNTGLIFAGRRLKGRTFIVPATDCFSTDGTLTPTAISAAQGAAAALIAAAGANLAVWGKTYNKTTVPPTQVGGALAPVDSATVKDQASQLRTRRT